jgi:hypothetical protein
MRTWFTILLALSAPAAYSYATGWSTPALLNNNINIGSEDWGTCISPDGQYLYFSAEVGNWDIYRSHWTGNDWGVSEQLSPGNICTSSYEADPFIDWDNQTLYFVSERNGTWDIWYSILQGGIWTQAQLIPGAVNTDQYDEFNLCITPDHQTMYYSSSQPCSLGAWNIWKSTWSRTSWINPQPLGAPINSGLGDYAPKLTLDGQQMYFCSGRWDIYLELCCAEWDGSTWNNVQKLPMPPNTDNNDFDCSVFVSGTIISLYYAIDMSGPSRIYRSDSSGLTIEPTSLGFIKAQYAK